jgi:hypothetical protein
LSRSSLRPLTIVVALAVGLAGCGSSGAPGKAAATRTTEPPYGALPSYLPKSAITPDAVLTGTAARPALTTEGDTVKVDLGGVSLMATVTGPEVPGEGLPYQAEATTCTWALTLSGATAPVPITVADFSTIDHLGAVYHPVPVPGRAQPPATLQPGQTARFELRAVMPTGEGLMRWAPAQQQIVASWDFEVEND